MIKVIVFDYDGVMEIKAGNVVLQAIDYLGVTKEEWRKVYSTLNHLSHVENHPWFEVLLLTAKKLGASEDQISHIHDLYKANDLTRKLNVEIVELIKDLKQRNYRIGLLSNYSSELRQKLIDHGILNLFDEIIISVEHGYQKPQPEIFKILFSKFKVDSNEVVFIDDSPTSLVGASDIGYTPILYKNNKELKEKLSKVL